MAMDFSIRQDRELLLSLSDMPIDIISQCKFDVCKLAELVSRFTAAYDGDRDPYKNCDDAKEDMFESYPQRVEAVQQLYSFFCVYHELCSLEIGDTERAEVFLIAANRLSQPQGFEYPIARLNNLDIVFSSHQMEQRSTTLTRIVSLLLCDELGTSPQESQKYIRLRLLDYAWWWLKFSSLRSCIRRNSVISKIPTQQHTHWFSSLMTHARSIYTEKEYWIQIRRFLYKCTSPLGVVLRVRSGMQPITLGSTQQMFRAEYELNAPVSYICDTYPYCTKRELELLQSMHRVRTELGYAERNLDVVSHSEIDGLLDAHKLDKNISIAWNVLILVTFDDLITPTHPNRSIPRSERDERWITQVVHLPYDMADILGIWMQNGFTSRVTSKHSIVRAQFKQKYMEDITDDADIPRIFMLSASTWAVSFKQSYVICTNTTDAILEWTNIVQREFNGVLGKYRLDRVSFVKDR